MPRGNGRDGILVDVYRNDPVFRDLRNPDALGGRCGRCEFREVCGGSRSRAFANLGPVRRGSALSLPADRDEPLTLAARVVQ
jgi:MoaA/NifB/PqqE/SkfB family radical SAM enzyme